VTKEQILSTLQPHLEGIRSMGVRDLALFGSSARNEAGKGSDIDFLVRFDPPPSFRRYADLADLLEDSLGERIDLITSEAAPIWLVRKAERDLVYVIQGSKAVSA
jgi:predicted nucleotidyltransferase